MSKQIAVGSLVLVMMFLLCGCAAAKPKGAPNASTPAANPQEGNQKMSLAELKGLYEAAKSEFERRAVCLRAIDEGAIYRGGPVSSLEAIFATHFAQDLPTARESKRIAVIDFVPFVPSPDNSVAAGHSGWYLAFEYDSKGKIQNYYLSNLRK
jgi:hypothetical protein